MFCVCYMFMNVCACVWVSVGCVYEYIYEEESVFPRACYMFTCASACVYVYVCPHFPPASDHGRPTHDSGREAPRIHQRAGSIAQIMFNKRKSLAIYPRREQMAKSWIIIMIIGRSRRAFARFNYLAISGGNCVRSWWSRDTLSAGWGSVQHGTSTLVLRLVLLLWPFYVGTSALALLVWYFCFDTSTLALLRW